MVTFQQLQGLSDNSGSSAARLQALQTLLAGELQRKTSKYNANAQIVEQLISSGGPLIGAALQRKADRGTNKDFGQGLVDLLGANNSTEGFDSGLNISENPTGDNLVKATQDANLQGGLQAQTARDPRIVAIENAVRAGRISPDNALKLANQTNLTPSGRFDTAQADEALAEYQSKQGDLGSGTSRRDLLRDTDIDLRRAQAQNYREVNSGGGASGGTSGSTDSVVKNAIILNNELDRRDQGLAALNEATRSSGQLGRLGYSVAAKFGGGGDIGALSRTLDASAGQLSTIAARLFDKGNLNEQEQKRALALVPQTYESIQVQKAKSKELKTRMQNIVNSIQKGIDSEDAIRAGLLDSIGTSRSQTPAGNTINSGLPSSSDIDAAIQRKLQRR